MLHEIVEEKLVCDSQPWISESGSRYQLFQHVQAFLYLRDKALSGEPLTRDSVLEAHKILMCNSTSETGAPILCGEFRTCSVSAGDHIYPSHEIISSQVDEILSRFNSQIADPTVHPVDIAVDLFYDLMTVHPFIDGNGRLCRLLAAYAFLAANVAVFPVLITSGHSNSRNHYLTAILRARSFSSNRKHLFTLFSQSLMLGWYNLQLYTGKSLS